MAKGIPTVTVTDLRFDVIARASDAEVMRHFNIVRGMSKKSLFPRVKWNVWGITRAPNAITLHFAVDHQDGTEPRKVAIFNFVPAPSFR